MEKRLRNLSILVSEFQPYALDLVNFACINAKKEVSDEILKRTFTLVFKALRSGKNFLPLHLFVYSKIIDAVKRSKDTPKKYIPNVKDLSNDIFIEDFDPAQLMDVNIFDTLNKISPEERILLCLSIRHKINNKELSTLFRTSPGTIASRIIKARTTLIKEIIKSNDIVSKKSHNKTPKPECFFNKNELPKEMNKHIIKCESCKNFYNWHNRTNRLLESIPRPNVSSSINRDVFKNLSHFSVDRKLLYSIRTKWTARTIFIILVISIISIAAIVFKKYKNYQHNYVQVIKINDSLIVAQKNDQVKYILSISAPKKAKSFKDMTKKLKEVASKYGEVLETNTDTFVKYELGLDKGAAIELTQEMQNNADFQMKTIIDDQPLGKAGYVRVDIQINKDGI